MELSTLGIIGISSIIALLLSWGITKCSNKIDDAKIGVGCISFLILLGAIPLGLTHTAARVIVIDQGASKLEHKMKYVLFSYNEHSVSFCKVYIDNQSDEPLLLYPAYYGTGNVSEKDVEEESVEIIGGDTFTEIAHEPDKYFYTPTHIYEKSKKKIKCLWILESLNTVIERENQEINKSKEILNSILL